MALSQCIKRRHLTQKFFEFHEGVKKCHFGNFSEGRDGHALLVQPSRITRWILKILFALGADEFLAMLEVTPFFKVQSGKITVCTMNLVVSVGLFFGAHSSLIPFLLQIEHA